MAYHNGPKVVTNGLVLALDAANIKSYPGSGTQWIDLTSNYTSSLNNGVGYSSINGGVMTFDGVDDRITLSSTSIISGTQDFTIEAVANAEAPSGTDYIFGNYGVGNNGIEFYFWVNKITLYYAGFYLNSTSGIIQSNTWYHVTATRNANTASLYVNGIFNASGSSANSIPTNNPYTIGNGFDYSSEIYSGSIAMVKVYNRALSQTEIIQNFNATRGRFGI